MNKLEIKKINMLRSFVGGRISSDEYYTFIHEYHKINEKRLLKRGCSICGTKLTLEYNEETEEVLCYRCYESSKGY
jgi:hypothetical protein